MSKLKKGDKLQVHCYKHNGVLYRVCDEAIVIDSGKDFLVCGNYRTRITEKERIDHSNFHSYKTNEPAILFFYKDCWFNVIGQFKDSGIYYYCNIATPYIIDDGLIKYIDYDLDLRIYPDGSFSVLDRNEYKFHKKKLNYGEDIDRIVKYELSNLIEIYKKGEGPFNREVLKKYHDEYIDMVAKKG